MNNIVSILALMIISTTVYASNWDIIDLDLVGYNTIPHDINNLGQVVGSTVVGTTISDAKSLAFLYENGKMKTFNALGGDASIAYAINEKGQIAGTSQVADKSTSHGFLYSNGNVTDVGTLPGGNGSSAYDINNAGQVIGPSYVNSLNDGKTHSFLYENENMKDIGVSFDYSSPNAINDSGQIVGYARASSLGPDYAFLYDKGTTTILGTGPGAAARGINNKGQVIGGDENGGFIYSNGQKTGLGSVYPEAINNLGQVVGTRNFTAFLYQNGTMSDLNVVTGANNQGWNLQWALDINDKNQIVGFGEKNGVRHAFLVTPAVPEPETYALMSAGLGLVAAATRRRKSKIALPA